MHVLAIVPAAAAAPSGVTVYPAPPGEELSKAFAVSVDGQSVPVYVAKVAPGDDKARWLAMDDKTTDHFETAAFAHFDLGGKPVTVTVTCPEPVREAKVLPSSHNIAPRSQGRQLSFTIAEPRKLTIEVNGNWVSSLHLFVDPPEADAPRPNDPNVLYFAPGVHEFEDSIQIGDGKTLYLAGGAILRAKAKGKLPAAVQLKGNGITFRGRGILDGSLCPSHTRNLLFVQGQRIRVEGIIINDSSTWNVPIRRSQDVTVRNVKIIGHRPNSDGIDVCNSRDVTVDDCFLRTLDDLVVVKSDRGQGPVRHIVVKRCVCWNQVAHALSVGAELREEVDDVLFTDCDVIHDTGREWTLRVYHCDSALIHNVRFEDIRIEESRRLFSVWIGKAVWSRDEQRGTIKDVSFTNVRAVTKADPPKIELKGFDAEHGVDGVAFKQVVVNGKPLAASQVKANAFVRNVTVQP